MEGRRRRRRKQERAVSEMMIKLARNHIETDRSPLRTTRKPNTEMAAEIFMMSGVCRCGCVHGPVFHQFI
jgi:hypothetical protein